MKGPAAIRELQVFCDLPAEAAIREAAAFFMERGLTITRQDAHSLGLRGPAAAATSAAASPAHPPASERRQTSWRPASWAPLMQRDKRDTTRDAGAVAAVTAQVDPGKCRVWLTVEGQGTVAARRGGTGSRAGDHAAPPRRPRSRTKSAACSPRAVGPSAKLPCAPTGARAACHRLRSSSVWRSSGNAGHTSPTRRSRKTSEADRHYTTIR